MRLPPRFWTNTLARLGLRQTTPHNERNAATSGRAAFHQRILQVESLEVRAMLTVGIDAPLWAAATDVANDKMDDVPAEVAPDDDFVGDGSAGSDSPVPSAYLWEDWGEGEGSSSGGGGGSGSGSGGGGGGPCTDPALDVSNGSANEGEAFGLSVSASISGGCSLTGYDVDWGDGSSGYFSALDTVSHTYVDDDPTATPSDPYTVSVVGHWDDNSSASDSGTVTVNNLAPTAAGDSADTSAGQSVSIGVLGNDTDPSPNDTLTVVGVNTSATQGAVTNNGDGTFEYDPSGAFDYLIDDETATDSFSYTIADDDTGTSTATVTITVHAAPCGPNTPRSVGVADASVDEGEAVGLEITANGGSCILSGYEVSWGDGTSDSYGPNDSPSHVYVDDNPTATPQDPYSVTVTAIWEDQESASDSATITVMNVAPTVIIDEVPDEVNENETFTIRGRIIDPGVEDTVVSAILYIDLNFDGDTADEDEQQDIELTADSPGQWTFERTTGIVLDDGATLDTDDEDEDEDITERIWGNGTAFDTLDFSIVVHDDDDDSTGGSSSANIVVNNVVPMIAALPTLSFELDLDGFVISATLSGEFADSGESDFHAVTAIWGSAGSLQETLLPGEQSFECTRFFDAELELEEADLYPLGFNVLDDDGGYASKSGGLSLELVTYETIVVNDDDDDDDGVADVEQSFVSGDDEPLPVYVIVNDGGIDLTGYEVEISYSGTIALWQSQQKGTPIPSGSRFGAGQVPSIHVEGTAEGSGQIVGRLFNPSGNILREDPITIYVNPLRIRRDQGPMALGAAPVWVGERINLDVAGAGVTAVRWTGVTNAATFKHYGGPAGVSTNNAFAKEYDLTEEDRILPGIGFYWVEGGANSVGADISFIDPKLGGWTVHRGVKFEVKRPNADLTSVTSDVYVYQYDGGGWPAWWVRFGNPSDRLAFNPSEGISFTKVEDAAAAGIGTYKLTQVVDTLARFWHRDDFASPVDDQHPFLPYIKISNGYVLDTGDPFSSVKDSPGNNFPQGGERGTIDRSDSFKMYLMWRPNLPGASFVPLRVTPWSWSVVADSNSFGWAWTIISKTHSTNPPSQDTTEFPEWTTNIVDVPIYNDL